MLGLLVATTFVMYFAPTPGASGVAEGVFGYAFSGLVAGGHLVLVTLAWRFLTIGLGMLVGVVVTIREMAEAGRPTAPAEPKRPEGTRPVVDPGGRRPPR